MGYEIGVTPLQLTTAFCGLVNGGFLLRPRLLKAKLDRDGSVVEAHDRPEVIHRVIPPEISRYVTQEILARVVSDGTGRTAALEAYQVVGKTGTARLTSRDRRGYEQDAYLSSFIGAAPAEQPQVVALVMIRRPNPELGYYGSRVAAPAVREILYDALAYLGIPGRGVLQAGL
jgi:cell division protein FtsI/penicillin-binding protein 2